MSDGWAARVALGVLAPLLLTAAGTPANGATERHWTLLEFSLTPVDGASHSWTVRLDAAGVGTYSESGDETPGSMQLAISPATLERLSRGEHAARKGHCEAREKNIAKTGEKMIRYQTGDGSASCTFNYSDDAGLMDAVTAFQSIAATMQAGERLQHEERYDRLGLDAEMDTLVRSVQEGTAIEVRNIAPVLQGLIDDEHVIDRVRRKAARLLQDPASVAAGADEDVSAR